MKQHCIYCGTSDGKIYGTVCNSCLMLGQASSYNLPRVPPFKDKAPPEIKSRSRINLVAGFIRLGCVLSIWGSGVIFGWSMWGPSALAELLEWISRGVL